MADWFKFYENDLDETRLQYAIAKLPEVIPVWVGILSEACRHKSGTVSWGKDEIELFGFSRRLGVTIPKVNEAINLLIEIRYITKQNDQLTVVKWGDKQSEYCQKKARVPSVSGHTPDSVRLEERRGEEKRGEHSKQAREPDFPEANGKPTLAEVLDKASMVGLAPWKAEDWFNEMQGCGWLDYNHRPVVNWQAVLVRVCRKWEADGRPKSPPVSPLSPKTPPRTSPESLEYQPPRRSTERFPYPGFPAGFTPESGPKREYFRDDRSFESCNLLYGNWLGWRKLELEKIAKKTDAAKAGAKA